MRRLRWATGMALAAACGGAGQAPLRAPVTLLTPEGAHQPSSSFSPDGSRVAFWATGATGWELRVAKADFSAPRVLAAAEDFNDPIVWSPDGRQIAFASNAASFMDVWVVSADSGAPRRLTNAPGMEFPSEWSADGKRLSYTASEEGGVFRTNVLDLATGTSRPMLAERRSAFAAWSPDGRQIAYQLREGSRSTIWLADSTGGNAKQLTTEGLESFEGTGSPWSPDGKRLVYVSRRTGTGDIWTMPVDGGPPLQLTHDIRQDGQPAWSPDGKWIAFISERGRQTDVWVMAAEGGHETRVTDDELVESGVRWVGGSVRLAFETGRGKSALYVLDAATGQERQLTPDSLRVTTFDISPGGAEVAFDSDPGGGVGNIFAIPLAGGAMRTLVADGANNGDPYWSPDGKRVLFSSTRNGSFDLSLVDSAGGAPRAVTDWPTDEVDGEWSSDSKTVYLLSGRGGGAYFDLYAAPAGGGDPKRLTTSGSILNVEPSRGSPDVFTTGLGAKAGQFVLSRILPDGKMQTLWDKSNVTGLSHRRISPSGDSLAVQVEQPGGGFASVIISVKTGAVHPILDKQETAGPWSPDGKSILYYFGSPAADLGVLDLASGTTRRLTNTPAAEGSTMWTPDGKSIVVLRAEPRRRIATADVAKLLGDAR